MTFSLGIDVGTTYTGVATATDGRAEIFSLGHDRPAAPTVVVVRSDGEILVGEAAERRSLAEADRVAREFKRRIGDPTPVIVGGTPYGVDSLFGHVLHWVYERVLEQEGEAPTTVTLTHPASWSGFKTDVLRQAARMGGLPAVKLLSEPEAAALRAAAAGRVAAGSIVAVYDFGGGTFDVALVGVTDSGFGIVGEPEGMERLGGLDFDQAVFAHVDRSLDGMIRGLDTSDHAVRAGLGQLRTDCRHAKEALSSDTDTLIPVLVPGLETEVRLTRVEFEAMIRPRVLETVDALRRCMASAGIGPTDVESVLLVGGSSRIPLVTQVLEQELGRPVILDTHPKFTIALGAAVQSWRNAVVPTELVAPTSSLPAPPAPVAPSPAVAPPAPVDAAALPVGAEPHSSRDRPAWLFPVSVAALIGIALLFAFMLKGRNSGELSVDATTTLVATAHGEGTVAPTTTNTKAPTTATTTGLPDATGVNVASISSADGILKVEVPNGWNEIDTSPFILFATPTAHISAAPSLSSYLDTWEGPGLTVSLVDPLEAQSAEALLVAVSTAFGYGISCLGGQSESYYDGRVSGVKADWTDCDGTSTVIRLVVGVVDDDPTWLVLAGEQAPEGPTFAELDQALATMEVLG